MSFQLINRRIHLYLGMFLLPWVLMYALSSLVFSHMPTIRQWDGRENPSWVTEWEKECKVPVPQGADMMEAGRQILADLGIDSPFFAGRQGSRVNILLVEFWKRGRVIYDLDKQTASLQTLEPRWYQTLIGFHLRAGYRHEDLSSDLWAVALDLVCVGFLVWIASGLYMWWPLRGSRLWGIVAIAGGIASFGLFLIVL